MSSLASYLARKKLSNAAFAKQVGVTESAVWRWLKGERVPSLTVALRIQEETGRRVRVTDWSEADRPSRRK